MWKRNCTVLLGICFLLFLFVPLFFPHQQSYVSLPVEKNVSLKEIQTSLPTILLDAGHGGFDGGSVALNGVIEKDINLAIAKKIKEQLVLLGFPVVMTRETDCSLEDDSGLSIRQRKVSDIHNREKLANSLVEPLLFLSIHQNKYEGASSFGTQIFYGCCRPESQEIAQFLQSFLRQELQPENHREIKQGTSDIYLLKNLACPAILIECGFLSNEEDLKKLSNEEYQSQYAFAVSVGLLKYYTQETKDTALNFG